MDLKRLLRVPLDKRSGNADLPPGLRRTLAALAGVAALAAGCTVGGAGIGVITGIAALVAAWLFVTAGAASGCYESHPWEDDALDSADVGPCLEAFTPDDAFADRREPCLGAPLDVCLSEPGTDGPPLDAGPCLTSEACLGTAPDAGDDVLPPCPPWYCDVCLNSEPPCRLECPPADAGDSASAGPAHDAGKRLAAAGILSPEQASRLARLRGRT